MEDILASIRKIIADEPPAAQESSPELAAGQYAGTASGIPLPAARDVLSGEATPAAPAPRVGGMPFLSTPQAPAAAPTLAAAPVAPDAAPPAAASRSRAAAIDDDLAGLIETPSGGTSPAPSQRPQAATSPVEAAREKWANLINPQGGAPTRMPDAPAAKAEQTPVMPPPAAKPVAVPAVAPATGLFTPRTGGFIPAQNNTPATPRAAEPDLPAKPVAPSTPPVPSATPSEVPKPAATFVPGFIPMKKSPEPSPGADATAPTPAPSADSATGAAAAAGPSAARPSQTAAVRPTPPPAAAKVNGAVADTASLAAARALDSLAAGLAQTGGPVAETSATPPVVKTPPAEPVASTAPAAPDKSAAQIALETTAASGTAAQPTALAKAVSAPADAGSRTLEDVVADMVRPMLQKWIDENMPRIVERALKRDPLLGPKSDT